jgi:ATP-dependent protease Clp ATPase subunit
MIAGPAAFICDECVILCMRIFLEDHPEWRNRLDPEPDPEDGD